MVTFDDGYTIFWLKGLDPDKPTSTCNTPFGIKERSRSPRAVSPVPRLPTLWASKDFEHILCEVINLGLHFIKEHKKESTNIPG